MHLLILILFPILSYGQTSKVWLSENQLIFSIQLEDEVEILWTDDHPSYEVRVLRDRDVFRYLSKGLVNRSFYSGKRGKDDWKKSKIFSASAAPKDFSSLGFVRLVENGKENEIEVRNSRSKKPLDHWFRMAALDKSIKIQILVAGRDKTIEIPVQQITVAP